MHYTQRLAGCRISNYMRKNYDNLLMNRITEQHLGTQTTICTLIHHLHINSNSLVHLDEHNYVITRPSQLFFSKQMDTFVAVPLLKREREASGNARTSALEKER